MSLDDWRMEVMKCEDFILCTLGIPHASTYFCSWVLSSLRTLMVLCTSLCYSDGCSAEYGKGLVNVYWLIVLILHSTDIFGSSMCKVMHFVWEIKKFWYVSSLQELLNPKQRISGILFVMMINISMCSQNLHSCQRRQ